MSVKKHHGDGSPLPRPSGSRCYGDRNIESLGKHYLGHLSAMTEEGLHSKSAIAAELAHRDYIIGQLINWIEDLADYLADDPHPNDGGSNFLAQSKADLKRILSENA